MTILIFVEALIYMLSTGNFLLSSSLAMNSFVKVICTRPNDIPPQIYVDVANVKAGEAIRLSNCNLPSGVFPLLGRGTDLVLAKLEKD